MKKLLFFILILCAAGYWGIREGNSSVKDFSPPRAASKSEPRRTEKNWLEELTGRIGTLITTPAVEEGKSNPSLSPDTEDSKKDSSLSTVKEKLGNILHFKESLEARVDRNKFISQKEIPDLLKKGIIATEDRRFYEHGAIDPIGVTRAAVTNYFAGRTLEGGSTITQQTVKNIFLSNDRTILRKMEELALAVQLEKYYTCRYGYFLQYVLGLRPRRRAELSADQSGTLMHWVLQMALDPHPGSDNPMAALQPFMELDDEAMASLAALLVDEYAKRYLPEDTARFAYLLSRLKKSMTSLLLYLRDEQRQSSFKPVACELKIGRGEDAVPAQVYHLSDGRKIGRAHV